jgi:hypothetical protein
MALGLLISITLIVLALWPDLEAEYYGFTRLTNVRFGGLRCPVLMAADEQAPITARVTNRTDYKANITVRAVFSTRGSPDEQRERRSFEPGQTEIFSWPLSAEDAVFNDNFVLARVYMLGAYTMPRSESGCGVYVLNMQGVNGMSVYWALFATAVVSLIAGVFLLDPQTVRASAPASGAPKRQRASLAGARRGLAIAAILGLYFSYAGVWIVGILCLVVLALILLGMLIATASR